MRAVLEELPKLQKLAGADAAGDAKAHDELLKSIRALQLAAETPLETTSRLNFQVSVKHPPCPCVLTICVVFVAPTEHLHSDRNREWLAACHRCKRWEINHRSGVG